MTVHTSHVTQSERSVGYTKCRIAIRTDANPCVRAVCVIMGNAASAVVAMVANASIPITSHPILREAPLASSK